jgi:hypothetical protein
MPRPVTTADDDALILDRLYHGAELLAAESAAASLTSKLGDFPELTGPLAEALAAIRRHAVRIARFGV